jgi:2-polyprenyl-3-methyl-5-hydroxy-6-metoxy-1,4-benzoquinol methylase
MKCDGCEVTVSEKLYKNVHGLDSKVYKLVLCENCGLITVFPTPSPDFLHAYYSKNYEGKVKKGIVNKGDILFANRSAIEDGYTKIKYIEKYAGYSDKKVLLDIGSGHGFFLYAAKQMGYEAFGLDIDQEAVDFCKNNFNISVYETPIDSIDSVSKKIEIVTAWQVLEHLSHPGEITRKVSSKLEPGGIFSGSVPNIGGIYAKIRGRKWYMIIPPEHLNYFTQASLSNMLQNAGLEPLFVGTIPLYASPYFIFGMRKKVMNLHEKATSHYVKSILKKIHRGLTLTKRHVIYRGLNNMIMNFNLEGNSLFFVARKKC